MQQSPACLCGEYAWESELSVTGTEGIGGQTMASHQIGENSNLNKGYTIFRLGRATPHY